MMLELTQGSLLPSPSLSGQKKTKIAQGQSDYTPTKQKHLVGILNTCTSAWNPTINEKPGWAHQEVIMIDCTAGSGRNRENNEAGSPILINEWATASYGMAFRQLCCEQRPNGVKDLSLEPMTNADILCGRYQDVAPQWMKSLKLTKPALGFIYCDPNGAQDLVEGLKFFAWAANHPRFKYLDFIFHWSFTAYKRNEKRYEWSRFSLREVVDYIATIKRRAFVRQPINQWQWVFMHCINTRELKGEWESERIFEYSEWKSTYGETVLS